MTVCIPNLNGIVTADKKMIRAYNKVHQKNENLLKIGVDIFHMFDKLQKFV